MNGDELEDPGRAQARQALGRSRGGLTTKVHLAVDGRGLPLSIVLTPGNVNDATAFPERRDQAANRHRRGALGGRPPAFDKVTYRDRNVAERCFARLKQFRAIATRFDKLGDRYRAGVVLASLILWLRESTG